MPWRRRKFYASCSSKNLTPSLRRAYVGSMRSHHSPNGIRPFWWTCFTMKRGPSEWERLHVGAERTVNCEHMQVLVTNIFQRHWDWQEDRRVDLQSELFRYDTAFMASLDVKTAFDVARPAVVSEILALMGVHGHLTAALLAAMQDVRGSRALRIARVNSSILGASAKEVRRLLCC